MKIEIKDTQRKITINKKEVSLLAKQILKIKGIAKAELSILFVGQQRMRTLNKKFRRQDKLTDVLAFGMREGKSNRLYPVPKRFSNGTRPEVLGDVVICPELAQSSAKIYKTTKEQEIHLYLIHGILHLLGYADSSASERSLIEKEQTRISRKLLRDNF